MGGKDLRGSGLGCLGLQHHNLHKPTVRDYFPPDQSDSKPDVTALPIDVSKKITEPPHYHSLRLRSELLL
jgi:hypothetical protein